MHYMDAVFSAFLWEKEYINVIWRISCSQWWSTL